MRQDCNDNTFIKIISIEPQQPSFSSNNNDKNITCINNFVNKDIQQNVAISETIFINKCNNNTNENTCIYNHNNNNYNNNILINQKLTTNFVDITQTKDELKSQSSMFNSSVNKNSLRIKKVIKPKRRNLNDLNQQYNESRYLFEREIDLMSRKNFEYMSNQGFIQPRMRKILFEWIIEVSSQLHFKRSTFHLAVALLDTFLSKYSNLEVNKLQLTGVTCLIIAAKFEVKILFKNFY